MRKKQEEVFIGYGSHLNIQTLILIKTNNGKMRYIKEIALKGG